MARIGIGLIGAGRHGQRYARHILDDVPELRLTALSRRDPEEGNRLAGGFGCTYFADYRELLAAPDVDAVVVVVPPAHHPEIVAEAVGRGTPVLLEKPAAITVEAGKQMLAEVRKAGVPVMMGHTLRYNGVVQAMLRERHLLGPLHAIRLSQHFEPSPLAWVDDPGLSGKGGILLHTGVHSFDLARLLSGAEAETVFCRATRVGEVSLQNNFSAVFTMTGGVLAEVSGSRATGGRSGSLELVGMEGQLIGDHVQNTLTLARGGKRSALEVPPDIPTVRETLQAFAGALRDGGEMPVALEEGIRAVAMAEACARASELESPVPVEEVV